MSDGAKKIKKKSAEEIYQLLKDLQLDLQVFFDDDIALKRHQFAALSRMKETLKELI
jgi:predicted metalloenzyme YecM